MSVNPPALGSYGLSNEDSAMGTRFLIVDDNEIVRRGLRGILQTNPKWEVCGEAADGVAALELLEKSRPDMVILDFQMPGINGLETARRMLAISPRLPIVLFTQHASADLAKHSKDVGIRAMVSKTETLSMIEIIEALIREEGSVPSE